MSRPTGYVMIGEPGSGKSTWIKNLPEMLNTRLLSTDAFIEERAKIVGKTYGEVFQQYVKAAQNNFDVELNEAVGKKQDIIWDQTNLTKKKRAEVIRKLRGYKLIAVVFEISPDELKRRREKRKNETGKTVPQFVLDNMSKSYERPTLEEGFHEIRLIES